MNRVLHSLKT